MNKTPTKLVLIEPKAERAYAYHGRKKMMTFEFTGQTTPGDVEAVRKEDHAARIEWEAAQEKSRVAALAPWAAIILAMTRITASACVELPQVPVVVSPPEIQPPEIVPNG